MFLRPKGEAEIVAEDLKLFKMRTEKRLLKIDSALKEIFDFMNEFEEEEPEEEEEYEEVAKKVG